MKEYKFLPPQDHDLGNAYCIIQRDDPRHAFVFKGWAFVQRNQGEQFDKQREEFLRILNAQGMEHARARYPNKIYRVERKRQRSPLMQLVED